jgi:mannose-6-phosphate isomerase
MTVIGPGARQLRATRHEKVWGTTDLSPIFPPADTKIGEVWFEDEEELPLLFKFLFTSERLSIQVHPDDAYARQMEQSRGKTEMWHVLRSDHGEVGLGFSREHSPTEIEAAARNGEIEQLLTWRPVKAGETYFVPAGQVHAIGAGVAICEIQQNSNVTYRLYDYGRPRELHLDHGLAVSKLGPYDGLRTGTVECEFFRTQKLRLSAALSVSGPQTVVVFLEGRGKIAGQSFDKGQAWRILRNATIEPSRSTTILHVTWP